MKQKKQEGQFLGAMMARSLIASMTSSLIQLAPSLLMNHIFRKGVIMLKATDEIAGKECNNMYYMDKNVLFLPHSLSNIEITKYFNYEPSVNGPF